MTKPKFKIGQKVVLTGLDGINSNLNGYVGTILSISTSEEYRYTFEELFMKKNITLTEKNLRRYVMKNNYFLKKKDCTVGRYLFSLKDGWVVVKRVTKEYVLCGDTNYTFKGKCAKNDKFPILFSKVPKGFKDPNKHKQNFYGLCIGDSIWSIASGWVKVSNINAVTITTDDGFKYLINGKWNESDIFPSLFLSPPEAFNKMGKMFNLDDKLYVWNNHGDSKTQRHFAHYDSESGVHCYFDGRSSLCTEQGGTMHWKYYEPVNK